MSFLRESSMEVDHDPPASQAGGPGTLKRSNSAPMINALVSSLEPHVQQEFSPPSFRSEDATRIRRFSYSSMCLNSLSAVSAPVKIPDRVNRLKLEESHIGEKERQHEKEVSSAIKLSTSWDELTLDDQEPMEQLKRPRSFSESLHIFTSPSVLLPGAPSPTRVGKQCFSPSMQIPVKNISFTPSPSPSPTRKTFMRSMSPIVVNRPSPVGKRKLDTDPENYLSPPKRFHSGPSTPDRILHHPLAHSISSSSLEEGSPDQTVPRCGGMNEVPTQNRLPPTHMYGFMPLHDSHEMQTTDSETSDIAESADLSDHNLSLSGSPGSSRGFQPIRQQHTPL
ncbi:P2R1A-PPP2R2A-interacting phosphatase regulator 1-like isoform X2 [Argopecten irradians]|uniref:P2R1A-PPP2R2A-interacting phosphatase regulator 1-like isoform X2 n=1 Tax=Argopecten irradians TaxID=31199 RepID=UPI0037242A90